MLKQLLMHAVGMAKPQDWPTYDGNILDRNDFLTSSEVAGCLRRSFFSKQNPGAAAFTGNGYAERGHAIETWFVEKLQPLKDLGYKLEYMGKDQRSFYNPETGQAGTPDGLITTPHGEEFGVEVKTVDPRKNKANFPIKKHVYQLVQNLDLMRKCLGRDIKYGILIYIDASDVYNVSEYMIPFDEITAAECRVRADILWNAENADDLVPEGIYNDDCDYCPFTKECSATAALAVKTAVLKSGASAAPFLSKLDPSEVREVGEEIGGQLNDVQIEQVTQFLEAKVAAKVYIDEMKAVEDDVKELITTNGGILYFNGQILTTRVQAGRTNVNTKAMTEAGIDIKPYMKQGAPFIVLTVKGEE